MKQNNYPTPTKAELLQLFDAAPDDANLDRKTVATWLNYSLVTLEIMAVKGGGPLYFRLERRVSYKKRDIVDWFNQKSKRVTSTSEKSRHSRLADSSSGDGIQEQRQQTK